jgi:hypothetical protein
MNKFIRIVFSIVLLVGVYAGAEEGYPLISGICLLETEAYQKGLPPSKIAVGLQVRTDTLYKISTHGQVFQGGIFPKGFNTLILPAVGFFNHTDTHTFLLECKEGESVAIKKIVIDIRIIPLYIVQKVGEERKKHEFTLSFFIGDQLIYSTKKFPMSDITFTLDLPPSDGKYNPFGLIDGTQKPISGVSILGAVAGIYHLAKSLVPAEEKRDEDAVVQKKQQIEMTFLKRNLSGDLWQWSALILIKSSDE